MLANFAATGRMAFGGGGDMAVPYRILEQPPDLTGCPEPLRAIVSRCLDKDPLRRPSPDEVIRLCAAALPAAWTVPDNTEVVLATGPVRLRSRRGWLAAGAIAAIVAVIGTLLVWDPMGFRSPASSGAEPGGGVSRTTSSSAPSSSSSSTAAPVPVQCGGKQHLDAGGSGVQTLIVDIYAAAYAKRCPRANVSYDLMGSDGGIEQFVAGKLDFAASDYPLRPGTPEFGQATARCQGNPPWHLPMVIVPHAIIYRLDGVEDLTLSGEVAAKIFNGTIKTWNDPAIRALNGAANLPDQPIQLFYLERNWDETVILQSYLKSASRGAWTAAPGTAFPGGTGKAVRNTSDLRDEVGARTGAIGYSTWRSDTNHDTLRPARIDSGHGPVPLTAESVSNAIPDTKIAGAGHDLVLDLEGIHGAPPAAAYPLFQVSYYIVCSKGYDPQTALAVKAFLTAAATDGQSQLDYGAIPLSPGLRARTLAAVAAIS